MPSFLSQLEVVVYQLREETAHRPLELLLRIGRTILKNPTATKAEVFGNPVFREYIWNWLLGLRATEQAADAQGDLEAAGGFALLPDEAPEEALP